MNHPRSLTRLVFSLGLVLAVGAALVWRLGSAGVEPPGPGEGITMIPAALSQGPKATLEGGVGWINTAGPIHMADLRGKVVLLDFWTYCCINCHHILPDLARLEEKYKDALVVIGVHTAKFEAEKDTDNIRKKVAEYRIKHPVINDAFQRLWKTYGVQSWPTLVLITPTGEVYGAVSGEGVYDILDEHIGKLVAAARAKGILDTTPAAFYSESQRPHEAGLLYPGKVLADGEGKRLFVSDTGHNRIVVTDLNGTFLEAIGSGEAGLVDGGYDRAAFNRQQGMCLVGQTLYVADVENHAIRAVDLKAKQVRTIAGTGEQSQRRQGEGPATKTGLNSPWDLLPVPGDPTTLLIAMAGPHQLWALDLEREAVGVWAGTGKEDINDGTLASASFAQPSGLATDGTHLFVADSEGSCVRSIPLGKASRVQTIVGTHDLPFGQSLFAFGDEEGRGAKARLQHCLGLAYGHDKLYIADTYNNKIKSYDPKHGVVATLAGFHKPGETDDPARFDEPGGLSILGSTLYVADTNNHAIRAIDLETKKVRTLDTASIPQPSPPSRKPSFPNPVAITAPEVRVAPGSSFALNVALSLPEGFKLNPEAPLTFAVEVPGQPEALAQDRPTDGRIAPPSPRFEVTVPLAHDASDGQELQVQLSVSAFICREGKEGLCTVKSYVWTVPVRFARGAPARAELTNPSAVAVR